MSWYYEEEGHQVGPLSKEEFQALVSTGTISEKTLVWFEGMAQWEPYGKIKGSLRPSTSSVVQQDYAAPQSLPGQEAACAECGRKFIQDEMVPYHKMWICADCKPLFFQKVREGVAPSGIFEYGGFWIRVGAKIIDGIILWIIQMVTTTPLLKLGIQNLQEPSPDADSFGPFLAVQLLIMFLQIVIGAVYTTYFLGRFAATPGKMVCNLKVILPDGDKVSYSRALGRHFAEWISGMILGIGYIMAGFDEEKRTLHDRICSTRVVRA